MIHLDPAMPHGVPSTLMKMVFRVMSPWIHHQIKTVISTAQDGESEYQQRIRGNQELYGMLDERFCATKPPIAPPGCKGEDTSP